MPFTSPKFYSACHTDDTRDGIRYIAHLYPNAPLLGLGFSVGANHITLYLGEEKDQARLQSGCAVGCVRRLRWPTAFHFIFRWLMVLPFQTWSLKRNYEGQVLMYDLRFVSS